MRKIPDDVLQRMAATVSEHDRDEMAIPSYLHGNPLMRGMAWWRVRAVADRVARHFAGRDRNDCSLLDFGCGTGVLFEELGRHAAHVYGVDIVLEPARLLVDEWRLDHVTLVPAVEADEVIAAGSLQGIVAAEVLEHIEPLEPTLAFLRSRLAPDGCLLVSLPTESLLYRCGRRLAGFHGHYHESNAAAIDTLICAAGFRRLDLRKIPAPGPAAIYWIASYERA